MASNRKPFPRGRKLRQRFLVIIALYTAVVLAMWWVYQLTVFRGIRHSAEQAVEMAENSLLMELDDELSRMAAVSSALSGSDYVQAFLAERDSAAYYEKAEAVSEIIRKAIYPNIDTDSIITFTTDGTFFRFTGGVSNEACGKLYAEIAAGTVPAYSVVELDGIRYFCLVSPVYGRGLTMTPPVGYVAALSDTAKMRRAMIRLNTVSGMDSAIILDGKVLLSTRQELDGQDAAGLERRYESVTVTQVTGSSLYVATAVTKDALRYAERMFITLSAVTLLALAGVLAALYRILSSKMVSPMIEKADNMQIGLLQTQISAHFLYNVVDCLEGLAERGETEKTAAVMRNLAGMIRSLNESEEEIHTFKELDILGNYTAIMNIRRGGKYEITVDMDDRLVEYAIPSHILQPIVENAMTHGMGNKPDDCRLTVTGRVAGEGIVFEVADNGKGMTEAEIQALQKTLDAADELEYKERSLEGVALPNIQRRIRTRYGKKYGLTVRGAPGKGVTVTVRLPMIPYTENEE
ncbi:MAG: histidine kinase [Clostridiales bacterium]|jgi:signal transduction histidine kinase|nr:histidine kinase [Clostridiales bacterium]